MKPTLLLLNPPARPPVMRDDFCSSTSKAGYLWQPIDLVCQSGRLARDFDLHLLDAPVSGENPEAALSRILALNPAAIYSLVGTAHAKSDFAFLQAVTEKNKSCVFVSGDLARFYPDQLLERYGFIEGVVLDFTSPALRDHLAGGEADPNALRLRNGPATPLPEAAGAFAYPVPRHDLFLRLPYRMPFLGKPFASILTNYGCPFSCTFCNSGRIGFSQRDPDNLFEELAFLGRSGIRHLFVKDFTFNARPARSIMILERWLEQNLRFGWIGYFRAESIDAKLAGLLKQTGCNMVQIGIETTGARVLNDHKPGASLDKMRRGIERLKAAGVCFGAHFVFGLPGDDEQGMEQTAALSRSLGLSYASFNYYTPRPGSALAGNAQDLDALSMDPSRAGAQDDRLAKLVARTNRRFYLRPGYMLDLFICAIRARSLGSVLSMGLAFLRGLIRKQR